MKKLVTALMVLSGINSNLALAASGTINYSGTVSTVCSFGSQTNGALAVDPSQPNVIASNATGGAPASVSITYFGTPTVTIQEIGTFDTKPNGVGNGDFVYSTAVSSTAGATYTSSGGYKSTTYTSGSSDNLTIHFTAVKSGNITLGNYAASGTITCQ